MHKILIFGRTGYLGSAFAESLSANTDYDIFITHRSTYKHSKFIIKKLYKQVITVKVDAKKFNDVKK